jgi:predicted RND superfamily exporter protein
VRFRLPAPRLRFGRPSPRALIALAGAAAVLGVTVLGLSRTTVDTGVSSFLPGGDAVAATDRSVESAFGGDPVVVLLETAQPRTLTSPDQLGKLLALEGQLAGLPDVASVYGPATVLNQITGQAKDLVSELVGYRDGLYASAAAQARERGGGPAAADAAGRAATAEFDTRYASLLVQGLPAGLPTLRNAQFVSTVVYDAAGDPKPQWRFVLPRADAAAILVRPRQGLDQGAADRLVDGVRAAVKKAGLDTSRTTVSGVPAITAAMAAGMRTEAPLLGGAALLAVAAVFGLVRWTGRRHRLLPLLSTVVAAVVTIALFGLVGRPLTLPVIVVLPILVGVGSDVATYLECRASRRTVAVVAVATSAAFAALAVTPVRAIADLGLALALGTLLALGTGMALTRMGRGRMGRGPADAAAEATAPAPPVPAPLRRGVRIGVGVAAVAVVAAGAVLLPGIGMRADLESFAAGLPALDDATHVESVLGSSGELTVAVTGPDTVTPQALEWMTAVQDRMVAGHGDQLRPVISPPTLLGFLGAHPTEGQLDAGLRLLPDYLTSSVVRADRQLSVLYFAVRPTDAQALGTLRDQVLATMPPPPAGLHVQLAGLPMAGVSAYEAVSAGRYLANGIGILAAGAVLLIGLRRRGDALRAVATALLATAAGVVAMRLAGVDFTPVTVALGSLTAAVGCEFSVLLASAARRRDPRLRRAVGLAAAVSATGYAVLGLSRLAVVSQFGLLLAASVALAYGAATLLVRIIPPTPNPPAALPAAGHPEPETAPRETAGARP